jgi:pimeloyl-ACP methyl ester carboxylesterase
MAHGLGGERGFRLPAFAEYFAREGLACLVFDYRNFGDSEGEPRNWVRPSRHLEDWRSAIDFAGTIELVNSKRLALWGTSFGGGHVIVTAANTPGISAIVAQVPFVDGRASSRGFGYKLQALCHALWDMLVANLFNRRHYVPIAGDSNTFALLNTPDALAGAEQLLPPGMTSRWKCPAAAALAAYFYRPIQSAFKVECPALFIYAAHDTLIPSETVKAAASRVKDITLVELPIEHFDIYHGEAFERAVRLEAEFLKRHLGR